MHSSNIKFKKEVDQNISVNRLTAQPTRKTKQNYNDAHVKYAPIQQDI
jgi:hypothetical protein